MNRAALGTTGQRIRAFVDMSNHVMVVEGQHIAFGPAASVLRLKQAYVRGSSLVFATKKRVTGTDRVVGTDGVVGTDRVSPRKGVVGTD
jgi:hypothetical protein